MPTVWTPELQGWYGTASNLLGYQPPTTSGLRSQRDNARVGGVANSFHLSGRSLDFVPQRGQSMSDLFGDLRATGIPFTELINEGDHVHATFPAGSSGDAAAATAACKQERGALLGWTCDTQAGFDILSGRRVNENGENLYQSQWSGLVSALSEPAVRVGVFVLAIALIIGALALMAAGSKDIQAIAGSALKAANPVA
jgi:hypothetical protein